ncbi:hypothetical protein [Pectobacterium polaris]|uniref:hypothetical protein n=1 Tax=Pectobacterium polaris TaxID=2042057 RepID=UPI0032EF317A
MKSQITLEQLKAIYAARDVFLLEDSALEMLAQVNEQADEVYYHVATGAALPSRTAREWAELFAEEEAHTQNCEAREYAQFHHDAYGDD